MERWCPKCVRSVAYTWKDGGRSAGYNGIKVVYNKEVYEAVSRLSQIKSMYEAEIRAEK